LGDIGNDIKKGYSNQWAKKGGNPYSIGSS
jgi:hypothetical protein